MIFFIVNFINSSTDTRLDDCRIYRKRERKRETERERERERESKREREWERKIKR